MRTPVKSDLEIQDQGFHATEATIHAATEPGRLFLVSIFGHGALGVTLPKSKAMDLAEFARQKGVTVEG